MNANQHSNQFDAAIFDLDGLLVDNSKLFISAWNAVLSEYDLIMSDEDYKNIYGRDPADSSEIIGELFKIKVDPKIILKKRNEHLKTEVLKQKKYVALPGVNKLLKKLSSDKIPIALASNSYRDYVERVLRRLIIANFFKTISCRDDVELGKPAPEIYQKTSVNLCIPENKCLVFEDSFSGALSAKRAGMKVVVINQTINTMNLKKIDINDFYSSLRLFLKDYDQYF